MDIEKFLERATALPGEPGYEAGVGGYLAEQFAPLADEVSVDPLQNVIARVGKGGPRVLICAHQDEIGLVVTRIEEDGCLRVTRNGGVDPRILPGMEVAVQAKSGPIYGVIGAKPPHLLTEKDREKALKITDLYVDIGYPAEKARELVRVGDMVVMLAKPIKLADGAMASKTMDDRASVAAMLVAAEILKNRGTKAEALFVSTAQEEVGSQGALVAAQALRPDAAIVIDVTHGEGPGTGKWEAYPLDRPTIGHGPNVHPALEKVAKDVAKENGVQYSLEVCSNASGTDAESTQVAAGGVPTILFSIPLKYMHTTVEVLRIKTIRETGRLIALFLEELSRRWEGFEWY